VSSKSRTQRTNWNKLVSDLNEIVLNGVVANTTTYRGYGFALELSTGIFWWQRMSDSRCKDKDWVYIGATGTHLSLLDAEAVTVEKVNGVDQIQVKCKKAGTGATASCWQGWGYPDCVYKNRIIYREPDATSTPKVIDKVTTINFETPNGIFPIKKAWTFDGNYEAIVISTTGDPLSIKRAVAQLKVIIAAAEKSPPIPE
jgi:hypothetical protein